jgi:hypothetical protein
MYSFILEKEKRREENTRLSNKFNFAAVACSASDMVTLLPRETYVLVSHSFYFSFLFLLLCTKLKR